MYTDALPGGADDVDGQVDEDAMEVTSHLLVAADRYGVERLKAPCEATGSLVKMLLFAEEQHCDMLKDDCIEFMASLLEGIVKVVANKEYAQLWSTHPSVLIDAPEKSNEFA